MCAPMARIHKFEQAGLGKSPFAFVGQTESVFVACPGAPAQPGTSCDYCGTAIRYVFNIRSADGKLSKVGSECIRKSGDAGLVKIVSQAEAAKRAVKNAERRAKVQAARIAAENADRDYCFAADMNALRNFPHPNAEHAANGRTLADYAEWMIASRYFGKLAATIKKAMA